MTYVITTNTPVRELIDGRMCETTRGKTTRRTVATLKEARFIVGLRAGNDVGAIPTDGTTIGPLSDGTTINVTRS